MRGHIGAEDMAEYQAGLIAGRRGRAFAAHLAVCGDCGMLADRLASVSALLAATPLPAVPEALTARLDAALATEMANAHLAERPVAGSSPAPASRPLAAGGLAADGLAADAPGRVDQPPRRSGFRRSGSPRSAPGSAPPWRSRLVAAAAAAALLGAAGYVFTRPGSSSSSSAASSAAGSAAGSGVSHAARSAQQPSAMAPAAAGPAPSSAASGSKYNAGSGVGQVEVVPSLVRYRYSTFVHQVEAQVIKFRSLLPAAKPASAGLTACVTRITGDIAPILVETATYNGAYATIIVAYVDHAERAWAVGPACSGTDSDIKLAVVLPAGISAP
jgi:hypothetical protein